MKTTLTDPLEHICGTCGHYDDICFCLIHPEWGEMVEQDTCDDWKDEEV